MALPHAIRRFASAVLLAVALLGYAAPAAARTSAGTAVPADCPITPFAVTWPNDYYTDTWYGDGQLRAGLDRGYGGRWFAGPAAKPVALKVLWLRPSWKPLTVEGRRLDAPGPALAAEIIPGYDGFAYQVTALTFPTAGCWEVVGRIPEAELRVVVRVLPSDGTSADIRAQAQTAGDDVWASLRRPLALPALGVDGACVPRASSAAGPVYAAGAANDGELHGRLAKGWWAVGPVYAGPVLVRGRRIDGPGELRFPYDGAGTELRLADGAFAGDPSVPHPNGTRETGWRYWAPGAVVPADGCYAVQIDGRNFSEVLVMPARL